MLPCLFCMGLELTASGGSVEYVYFLTVLLAQKEKLFFRILCELKVL